MTLTHGTRLGPYEIAARIGAGGMGEVYRATDVNLKRQVAIKVLPASLAGDPDRLARFRREAEVLASLNHPHIAQIHGLERSDGHTALVMELVEGPTLADRIAEGPIPVDEALPIATQIAEALEAAHEQGIIHRDLKPANIKVKDDGAVKVLDFGLAKALEPAGAAATSASMSPTITTPAMTRMGVILGTAAYMAPEQAKGRAADKRSDVWAFGTVLYEMLTGQRAFEGEDVSDTLSNVLKGEPNWKALPAGLSPTLTVYLLRCLQRDPKQRLGDIHDMRLALEGAFDTLAPGPYAVGRSIWWERGAWAALVLILIALLVSRMPGSQTSQPPTTRLTILPTAGELAQGFALSPDGRRLAYSAAPPDGGRPVLWVWHLGEADARPLDNTAGAEYPFWSPDGSSIGFFAAGQLKRVGSGGSAVRSLCEAPARPRGGSWNQDDVIIFASWTGPMQRVSAEGGIPETIPLPDSDGSEVIRAVWPTFLPDGRRYLYARVSRDDHAVSQALYVASLDRREPDVRLLELPTEPSRVEYGAPGYLLYADRTGILVAQPVDPHALTPTGPAVPVSRERIASPFAWPAFSVNGDTLLFQEQEQRNEQRKQLVWVDRRGSPVETLGGEDDTWQVAVSQDGQRVAATARRDIWLYDAGGNPTRVTSHPALNRAASWAPDNRRIAFTSYQNGTGDIFVKDVGSSGDGELLIPASGGELEVMDWSGPFLVMNRLGDTAPSEDIWVYSMADGALGALIETRYNEYDPQLSVDNRWLAYTSDESGEPNVYLRPFPGPGTSRRVSPSGGAEPRWRGDGRELYYLAPDRSLMAVPVSGGVELETGAPVRLFRMNTYSAVSEYGYDVTPDGQRFLTIVRNGVESLSIVFGWRAELEVSPPD